MSTFNRKRQIMEHESNVQDEIDIMWQQAMRQSIEEGEMFTRYHFAKLIAAKAIAELEQRTWVGLTDEEIIKAFETSGHKVTIRPQDVFAVTSMARAIEAELKEKNSA
jgi:hypothetical protein